MTRDPLHYTWHPAVHEHHQESLSYYALTIRPIPGRSVREIIDEVTRRAGVRAYCGYIVYGRWDVLVRLWLNQYGRERLNEALSEAGRQVAGWSVFVATGIRYCWTGTGDELLRQKDTAGVVLANADLVRTVIARSRDIEMSRAEAGQLTQLAFERSDLNGQSVKAYSIFRLLDDTPPEAGAERIVETARNLDPEFKASIYTGEGRLGDVLVKIVAPTFARIGEATELLGATADAVRASIETVLIGSVIGAESDNVNDSEVVFQNDSQVMDVLGLDTGAGRDAYLKLLPEQRAVLNDATRRALKAAGPGPEASDNVKSFLAGNVMENSALIRQGAGFLPDIETDLGEYLPRMWHSMLGQDWLPIVRDVHRAAMNEGREPPNLKESGGADDDQRAEDLVDGKFDRWTLGTYVAVAESVATAQPLVAGRMRSQLGDDWSARLRRTMAIRNDYSHGRLTRNKLAPRFSPAWVKRVDALADAAALADTLTVLADEPDVDMED